MNFYPKENRRGFTLIEMIVVVAIVGLLVAGVVVIFGNTRQKSRDTHRVGSIKQITDALELYYLHNGIYPTSLTPGQILSGTATTYLNPIPSNPTPRIDGGCANQNYSYTVKEGNADYELKFCLGAASGGFAAGINVCSQGGRCSAVRPDTISGLLLWLRADWLNLSDGDQVSSWTDSSGNNNHAIVGVGTASMRPTYVSRSVNNKPALRYDGIDDVLRLTTGLTSVRTIFVVMKWSNQVNDYVPLLGGTTTYDFHGSPGSSFVVWGSYSSTCLNTGASAWNNGTTVVSTSIPKDRSNFQLIEIQTSCNATVTNISQDRYIAGRAIHGEIAEVILYDNVISTANRQKVERYLKSKYNLTVAGI